MKLYVLLVVCAGLSVAAVSCREKPQPHLQQQRETTTVVCDSPASVPIDTSQARKWLKYYKKANPNNRNRFASTTFDEKAVIDLLNLPGVEGIKIYYAYDREKPAPQTGTKPIHYARLILMPVNGCGTDLIDIKSNKLTEPYYMLTSPMRCPDNCDQNQ
jgi:hypothetical protein